MARKKTPVIKRTNQGAAPIPQKSKVKRGFLSKEELETVRGFIAKKMSVDEIALKIGRSVKSTQTQVDKLRGVAPSAAPVGLAAQLQCRPEWKKWEQQFTQDELEQFQTHYIQLMAQFENNVKPTEELQVFQVITLIILIDRTMKELKQAMEAMNDWEMQIAAERENGAEADKGLLAELQAQFEMSRSVSKTCSDKYKTYSDKQDKMLHQLKATRDQRVNNFEESGKSFMGLLRWLTDDDNKTKVGREAELMRVAAKKEQVRMGSNHKYRDGTIDRPLLTPETVLLDDEEKDPIFPA